MPRKRKRGDGAVEGQPAYYKTRHNTILGEFCVRVTWQLIAVQEASARDAPVTLPDDLSNTERRFVHMLARNMGLVSVK